MGGSLRFESSRPCGCPGSLMENEAGAVPGVVGLEPHLLMMTQCGNTQTGQTVTPWVSWPGWASAASEAVPCSFEPVAGCPWIGAHGGETCSPTAACLEPGYSREWSGPSPVPSCLRMGPVSHQVPGSDVLLPWSKSRLPSVQSSVVSDAVSSSSTPSGG